MLNLKEMLIGMPTRLRYVDRFSTCRVIKKESVAEHCFFVALYSLFITWWCSDLEVPVEINEYKILSRALLHDLDEAATGDVPRFFKYSDPALKQHLDEVAQKGVETIAQKLWSDQSTIVAISDVWKTAKDNSREGRILAFADFLSVLSYSWEEVRQSNIIMKEHLTDIVEYYQKFTTNAFDFLRPLIEDARAVLFEEILTNGTQ